MEGGNLEAGDRRRRRRAEGRGRKLLPRSHAPAWERIAESVMGANLGGFYGLGCRLDDMDDFGDRIDLPFLDENRTSFEGLLVSCL